MFKMTLFFQLLLIGSAMAQDGGAGTGGAAGQQSAFGALMPFVIIFVIFYFLMIRPQKKKMEQEQNLLNALQKGDEIFTKSGMLGTISGLTDKVVTLELAEGIKVKMLRSQVGGFAKAIFETKEEKKK